MKPVLTAISPHLRKTGPVPATETSPTRPYRVHVDVLAFAGSFWKPQAASQRWADLALTAEQAETLAGGADRDRILKSLTFPVASLIGGWSVATATLVLLACIPGVFVAVLAAAWTVMTGAFALVLGRHWRFLGRARRRIDRVFTFASVGGAIERVELHGPEWSQLYRIHTALTALQAHAGSAYDGQARAAVRHVFNPPPPPRREPDTAPKGTSPQARYRAAMHGVFTSLLRPPAPAPVDPVAALEAEAARVQAR